MGYGTQLVVAVGVALLAAITGWPVTSLVLRASQRSGSGKAERKPASSSLSGQGQLRGGLWIGLVERFSCALAILLGQPGLVAVVVAVKGLGRFKEITTPEASERFVLGTLVSVTWACLCGAGGLVLWL